MKVKIAGIGVIAAAAAAVATAVALGAAGGGLPPNVTAGHIVLAGVEGGDPGSPQIDVLSWSWGATNNRATPGAAQINDVSIAKTVDKASPKLFEACVNGVHFSSVILSVDRPSGSNKPYLEYKMTDVFVSSINHGGHGTDFPVENITFNFQKLEMKYTALDGNTVQTVIINSGRP